MHHLVALNLRLSNFDPPKSAFALIPYVIQIAAGACSAPRGGKIKFSHLQYDATVYDRQGGAAHIDLL
jgi:hypothetical protein